VAGGVVVVVGVAALAGWLTVGLRPDVVPGSAVAAVSGVRAEPADGAVARYVVDGATGTVRVTVRNAGRVPVTVLGLADGEVSDTGVWAGARLAVVTPGTSVSTARVGDAAVSLGRDEEAAVELTARLPPCAAYDPGASLTAGLIRLDVRSLGLTTQQDVAITPVTLRIRTGHRPEPGCR
jgi:hypothetical protein